MNLLAKLLADNSGSPSTMRAALLLTLFGVFGPKLVALLKTGVYTPLTPEEMGVVMGAFGGKAAQSWAENQGGQASSRAVESSSAQESQGSSGASPSR